MNFKLRPWQIQDIESLVKHANNPKIANNLTDGFPHPYSRENAEVFIKKTQEISPFSIFAIDIEGEAVGSIGLHFQSDIYRMNAELGYWISEEYWGNGIMHQAITEMVDYGFTTFNINRIFARPFSSNTGSRRVLEKAGFKLEGHFTGTIIKNNQILDELIYAIRKK